MLTPMIRKVIAVILLVLIPSVVGVIFFTVSILGVLAIMGDVNDFSELYSKENVEKNYISVLFTLVVMGPIGFGVGVKLWKIIMKKTNLVSQSFLDYWYGE